MFFKPDLLQLSLSMWKEQYPDHPANAAILYSMVKAAGPGNTKIIVER